MRISDWSSDVCSSDLYPPNLTIEDDMTRQTVRSARLVSVCLLGKKAIRVRQNRIRTEFALAVIRAMQAADWPPIGAIVFPGGYLRAKGRSEEHTSELQSLMSISYAVLCLKTKTN